MDSALLKLKKIARQSVFNQSPNYSVNLGFREMFQTVGGLLTYSEKVEALTQIKDMTRHDIISEMTPEFQRSNTKWTQEMQKCFVENLLCGCETKIHLYDVLGRGGELADCLLLDGLQRSTAIAAFQEGEFDIFDGIKWESIESGGIFPRLHLIVNIFTFDSDLEACEFYIQMNKGITHSESDLESAYEFVRKHKSA